MGVRFTLKEIWNGLSRDDKINLLNKVNTVDETFVDARWLYVTDNWVWLEYEYDDFRVFKYPHCIELAQLVELLGVL